MRVALVASRYAPLPGALERHVEMLGRGLAERGVHVEVLTQHPGRALPRLSEMDGILVRRFPAPIAAGQGALSPSLCEHLRRRARSFDLVHVHSSHAPLGLAVARAHPRRMLFTPHAPMQRLMRWPYTRVTAAVLQHALRTVPTSRTEGDLVRRRFPALASRVHVIPTGVDREALLAARDLTEVDGDTVLTVARLERHKRVERTIAAMAAVPERFRLAVVGAGPAFRTLTRRMADLRLSRRVYFLGPLPDDDLYRWLRTARVFVSVAEQDASGAPVLEALTAGAPVVASDIPVHREAAACVMDAPVVFVPSEPSPLHVADAICEAARLQSASPASAVPCWDAVADKTLRLYAELVSGPAWRNGRFRNGASPTYANGNGIARSIVAEG
jgi:glycosyltransferase involved in cell wall biosynthesis